jgi:hypothetical protein
MESSLGTDFSAVRIHQGGKAAAARVHAAVRVQDRLVIFESRMKHKMMPATGTLTTRQAQSIPAESSVPCASV